MDSFEDLGLKPELVEALLAEGIEAPTALQQHAIPVLRRGNPAVLRGGPGAGSVVAYGAPLLDRLEPGAGQPRALILTSTRDRAFHVARSLGRLGRVTGHRCASLGGPWALPGHADLVVATPSDVERAVGQAELKVEAVEALVLEGAGALLEDPDADAVQQIVELLAGRDVQGVAVADPITPAVRAFADAHLRRAVFLPSEAAAEAEPESPVQRGTLHLRSVESIDRERAAAEEVARALEGTVHHVLLFVRSDDRAADLADLLAVHGFVSGSPGEPATPVWVGIDAMEARKAVNDSEVDGERVLTVSVDVPADLDALDRRHGGSVHPGLLLAHPRELPHLRRIAREAGYRLEEAPSEARSPDDSVDAFRRQVTAALEGEDLATYTTLLEPLLERWTGVEIAAALAALFRRRPSRTSSGAEGVATTPGRAAAPGGPRPPAWTRLFLSIGSRDGVGPGDIVGAITGEANLEGDQVGRIDIRDTFSRVEVQDAVAEQVIQALNGITIRGRSVRADFDRGDQRGGGRGRGEGSRRGR